MNLIETLERIVKEQGGRDFEPVCRTTDFTTLLREAREMRATIEHITDGNILDTEAWKLAAENRDKVRELTTRNAELVAEVKWEKHCNDDLAERTKGLREALCGLLGQIDKARGSFRFDDEPLNAARAALAHGKEGHDIAAAIRQQEQ